VSDQNLKLGSEMISTPAQSNATFNISAVNIENNATQQPVNYVLPPGINRQSDPSNPQLAQLNEQSMVLNVANLANGDARAAYKNVNLDLRFYQHLIMDVHEERVTGIPASELNDYDLSVFLRMGSDDVDNYYEYDVPLHITRAGVYNNNSNTDRDSVWPEINRLDFDLSNFQNAKLARDQKLNSSSYSYQTVFPYTVKGLKGTFYVRGNPNTANIKTLMIGVRYTGKPGHAGSTRTASVWVDELRVTNFQNKSGWAAELSTKTKLSNLGTLDVSGGIITPGFGGL